MDDMTALAPLDRISPELASNAHDYADALARFVAASPSSYHAVAEVARLLDEVGFRRFDEQHDWGADDDAGILGNPHGYVIRDGAIIAWVRPTSAGATTPFRVMGSHTDSPGFKLKPHPTIGADGWVQAAVEIYGGPLLTSWLDRELELAGRLVTRDGSEFLARTGPMLRIPQLAVHLDRDSHTSVTLDKQRHTAPVLGIGDVAHADVLGLLATAAGQRREEVAGYDIVVADTQAPRRFGLDGALLASGRLDNLASVFASLVALATMPQNTQPDHIAVLAAFDHEELGSQTRSGASGPFLADVLGRLSTAAGAGDDERARAFAASWCVSADVGHAVHPNYPEKHDPAVRPALGGGVLLKINANQRYATDAHGAALWARICEAAQTPTQEFVSRNDVPCGSTTGPLTATRFGIRTLDVGVPVLSMHSARELAHADDLAGLARAASEFFAPR